MGLRRKSSEHIADKTIVSVARKITYCHVRWWIPVWTDRRLFRGLNRAPRSHVWSGLLHAEKYVIIEKGWDSRYHTIWAFHWIPWLSELPRLGKSESNERELGLTHLWFWLLLLLHWNLPVGRPELPLPLEGWSVEMGGRRFHCQLEPGPECEEQLPQLGQMPPLMVWGQRAPS